MPPLLKDWAGLVTHRTDDLDGVELVSPGGSGPDTWAGPFRGVASDNIEYFVKTLQGCPPGRGASLAVEFIVAQVGELICAPVCTNRLVRITKDFEGMRVRSDLRLKEGWAFGSRIIDHSNTTRPKLAFQRNDDNRKRHAGIHALYDWCYGKDPQWLHDLSGDQQTFSFDHGLYFPKDQGPKMFTREMLLYHCDDPRLLEDSPAGLSLSACTEFAESLRRVTRQKLVAILNGVPRSWPVSNDDLEALGWFLEYRAPLVADRVEHLVNSREEGKRRG